MSTSSLTTYTHRFPERITVIVEPEPKGGFVARVREFPGCITEADNYWELVEMVNDAVRCWLDAPVKYEKELPYYVPPSPFIRNPLKRRGTQVRRFARLVPA